MDWDNALAIAWAVLYCALVVVVGGTLVAWDVPPYWVVPIALFVLPLLTSVPFIIREILIQRRDHG